VRRRRSKKEHFARMTGKKSGEFAHREKKAFGLFEAKKKKRSKEVGAEGGHPASKKRHIGKGRGENPLKEGFPKRGRRHAGGEKSFEKQHEGQFHCGSWGEVTPKIGHKKLGKKHGEGKGCQNPKKRGVSRLENLVNLGGVYYKGGNHVRGPPNIVELKKGGGGKKSRQKKRQKSPQKRKTREGEKKKHRKKANRCSGVLRGGGRSEVKTSRSKKQGG